MGRTLVQWASHATWSAPRRAACIGISQQWRAYLTDGNSVTQAQVTSIKKNFINLPVVAGEQKLHSGRASGGTSGHSEPEMPAVGTSGRRGVATPPWTRQRHGWS